MPGSPRLSAHPGQPGQEHSSSRPPRGYALYRHHQARTGVQCQIFLKAVQVKWELSTLHAASDQSSMLRMPLLSAKMYISRDAYIWSKHRCDRADPSSLDRMLWVLTYSNMFPSTDTVHVSKSTCSLILYCACVEVKSFSNTVHVSKSSHSPSHNRSRTTCDAFIKWH